MKRIGFLAAAVLLVALGVGATLTAKAESQVEKARVSTLDELDLQGVSTGRNLHLYHLRPQGVCFLLGNDGLSMTVPCPWDRR